MIQAAACRRHESDGHPEKSNSHGPILNEWRNVWQISEAPSHGPPADQPTRRRRNFSSNVNYNPSSTNPTMERVYAVFGGSSRELDTVDKSSTCPTRSVKEYIEVPAERS
jgi:hypothetical protein